MLEGDTTLHTRTDMSLHGSPSTLGTRLERTVALPATGGKLTYSFCVSPHWRPLRCGRDLWSAEELFFEAWHLPGVGYLVLRVLDPPAPSIESSLEEAERHLPACVLTDEYHKELVRTERLSFERPKMPEDLMLSIHVITRSYDTTFGPPLRAHVACSTHSCQSFCLQTIMVGPSSKTLLQKTEALVGSLRMRHE